MSPVVHGPELLPVVTPEKHALQTEERSLVREELVVETPRGFVALAAHDLKNTKFICEQTVWGENQITKKPKKNQKITKNNQKKTRTLAAKVPACRACDQSLI